jgi:hypothetical protein
MTYYRFLKLFENFFFFFFWKWIQTALRAGKFVVGCLNVIVEILYVISVGI